MALVHLVRHGTAAAGWGEHSDPGLAPAGRAEAVEAARHLGLPGVTSLLSSPMARARQTAELIAAELGATVRIDPALTEVPAPQSDRQGWLSTFLAGRWSQQPPSVREWRSALLDLVAGRTADTIAVTHFVAINAVVAAANGDDRVVVAPVVPASVTVVAVEAGDLRVVRVGDCGESTVR